MHEHNLAALSREALLELAAAGCAENDAVCRRTEVLLSQQHPLPDWCVQVLPSPDLLPNISLGCHSVMQPQEQHARHGRHGDT
jgi:hypothetical protein